MDVTHLCTTCVTSLNKYNSLLPLEQIMNRLRYLEQGAKRRYRSFLGQILKQYLVFHGCKVGRNLSCYSLPRFRAVPSGNIEIGDSVTFGYDCTIEVVEGGTLCIKDHANITQNVLISCADTIVIGRYSLIGENVSIRDSNHGIARNEYIAIQDSESEPVFIDDDVWIGAFSMVLKGANVQTGAVIGGNSFVHGSSSIEPYGVYVGSPVRFLKWRDT